MKLEKLIAPLLVCDANEIIEGYDELCGMQISDIAFDSRKAVEGSLFVCINGSAVDGHDYVEAAVKNGAVFVVAEREVEAAVPVLVLGEHTTVSDSRKALALMSAELFGRPADTEIKVIGITGTKGKTTTAMMLRSILETAGKKTGVIGTLGVLIGEETTQINNTTPSSYEVQKYLRQMADAGCEYCVMEASSIGLKDYRVFGFELEMGVFTNFSEDHIGGVEHKDMQEYLESKSMLFKMCKTGVINIDDENHEEITAGHTCEIKTYSMLQKADFRGDNYNLLNKDGVLGISFDVSGEREFTAEVGLPGRFNAYNALAAISVCSLLNVNETSINEGLRNVKVKGRVEKAYAGEGFMLLIDYAHNAVSMESLLTMLREYNPKRLVCMFGAGGNRPKVRRYEMGEASGKLADLSVITSDNPRFEKPLDIIADIITGMEKTDGKYIVIPDRREAIRHVIETAEEGDIIVLAGKGQEDYQEIEGVKHHLDEREVIAEVVKSLGR